MFISFDFSFLWGFRTQNLNRSGCMEEVQDVTPLGGNLYIVSFKPSPIDEILFGGKSKPIFVRARNKQEAIKKALKKR
ncbi:MAG: hypothetical protein DRP16_02725 [Candidatus Aenigmatarchaeota archaeon]|nr:MAG: hypothetical protein DRP16_02725 [Candidatus Aenigmarchaeota archaeon]